MFTPSFFFFFLWQNIYTLNASALKEVNTLVLNHVFVKKIVRYYRLKVLRKPACKPTTFISGSGAVILAQDISQLKIEGGRLNFGPYIKPCHKQKPNLSSSSYFFFLFFFNTIEFNLFSLFVLWSLFFIIKPKY